MYYYYYYYYYYLLTLQLTNWLLFQHGAKELNWIFAVYYAATVSATRQKGCSWQRMVCTTGGGVTFPRKVNLNVTAFRGAECVPGGDVYSSVLAVPVVEPSGSSWPSPK